MTFEGPPREGVIRLRCAYLELCTAISSRQRALPHGGHPLKYAASDSTMGQRRVGAVFAAIPAIEGHCQKSQERDFTETIKILAGLSLFVIADITNPKSNPLELQAFVPDYMIPLVPVLQDGETPFSMFISLQTMYNWVLPVIQYASKERLLSKFEEVIME